MKDLAKLSSSVDSGHTVLLLLLVMSTPALCQVISGGRENFESIFTVQNRESELPAVMVSFMLLDVMETFACGNSIKKRISSIK